MASVLMLAAVVVPRKSRRFIDLRMVLDFPQAFAPCRICPGCSRKVATPDDAGIRFGKSILAALPTNENRAASPCLRWSCPVIGRELGIILADRSYCRIWLG